MRSEPQLDKKEIRRLHNQFIAEVRARNKPLNEGEVFDYDNPKIPSDAKIRIYELVLMAGIAFIIVFGCAGLYNQAAKEIVIHCQEGC